MEIAIIVCLTVIILTIIITNKLSKTKQIEEGLVCIKLLKSKFQYEGNGKYKITDTEEHILELINTINDILTME